MVLKSYTYLLHHKPTNTFYYGVRWANIRLGLKPDQDFWISYFTRSDRVALLRTLFGDESFEFEIRQTFKSIKRARAWETKVLRRIKVLEKPDLWLNRTNNKAILNEIHPRGMLGKTGWHHTEQTKAKMRKPKKDTTNMGKYERSTEWRNHFSEIMVEKMSGENNPMFGRGPTKGSYKPGYTSQLKGLHWKVVDGHRVYY